MELCPDISKVTVERTLTDLVKSGYIAKVGAGPSTGYVHYLKNYFQISIIILLLL